MKPLFIPAIALLTLSHSEFTSPLSLEEGIPTPLPSYPGAYLILKNVFFYESNSQPEPLTATIQLTQGDKVETFKLPIPPKRR